MDAASGPAARLAAAVYRASAHLHRGATAGVRRQLLALDAARYGDRELSARINATPVEGVSTGPWGVEWAAGMVDHCLWQPLAGHTSGVSAVATGMMDGLPVVVAGGWDAAVQVWDLARYQPVGEPLTGHTGPVLAVATGVLEGRSVAVTGSDDFTVRVWDLATGRPVGEPLTGHADWVLAVATGVLEGRSVAVTGSDDFTVRVWDLATGQPVGEPLTGYTDAVWAVTTGVVDSCPVAVTGGRDGTVRVWDLTTGQQVGSELVFPAPVAAVAVAADSRLVVGFGPETAVLARC
ncbi:hypothetical protein ABZX85_36415 [Streptomyces sp. NPDC004539]|uniref:hypothetical protein n=1 Tax=Streptomyces sp. NPDC004539 TaxID=3154280 RepID=UPI0033B350B1